MQLFTRQLTTVGMAAVDWATRIRAVASTAMETDIALWSVGFGAPAGTLAFTARVEGIADLTTKAAPLADDAAYADLLAAGTDLVTGPSMDSLATPVHGELGDPPPVGSYASVTNATIANGRYAEAVGWGIDVAQHVTSLTDMPIALLTQEFGPFGVLTWIGVSADAAGIDQSARATNGDADYIAKLSAAGDLFVPGSGTRALVTRIA